MGKLGDQVCSDPYVLCVLMFERDWRTSDPRFHRDFMLYFPSGKRADVIGPLAESQERMRAKGTSISGLAWHTPKRFELIYLICPDRIKRKRRHELHEAFRNQRIELDRLMLDYTSNLAGNSMNRLPQAFWFPDADVILTFRHHAARKAREVHLDTRFAEFHTRPAKGSPLHRSR